ncbi:T6SS protein Cts1U [Citrobacter freundii]|nr:T6SS protein Cts1U [Citrobacter freundii]
MGGNGVWSASALLVTFHNETRGGEKFFQLLARLSQNPREHINLLELINYCLLLGFEGRYRVMDNGRTQLETIRQRLLLMISSVRGGYAPLLSVHSKDHSVFHKPWHPLLPVWASTALTGFVCCFFYIILSWRLSDFTTPVMVKIYQMPLSEVTTVRLSGKLPTTMSLRDLLRSEIAEGLVAVRNELDHSVIILKGDGLFASASTVTHGRYDPVIERIALAINNINGQILVAGYSDNVPIRGGRFASNYELSFERARAVQKQLQKYLTQPERVKAEGRGELNPVVPNTTGENRARNRRVEITLLASPENTRAVTSRLPPGK